MGDLGDSMGMGAEKVFCWAIVLQAMDMSRMGSVQAQHSHMAKSASRCGAEC